MEKKMVRETFIKFFVTALASSAVLSVLSMTDLMIAGNAIGEKGLAAVSLALPITMAAQIGAALWGMGGAIVFSSRLGEGDLKACGRILTLSLAGAAVTGLILSLAGLMNLNLLVRALGAREGEESLIAGEYLSILLMGFPFLLLSTVMVTFLRNDSRQGYSFICVVSSAVFNLVCSLFFCFGLGLGIRGIGAATVMSQMICCFMAGAKLLRKKAHYGLVKDFFSLGLMAEIFKPGSTAALIFFCQILLTVAVNRILNAEGGAAVYGVVKYMINLLFSLFDGVTGAIQPMLGIYYGEREKENISLTAEYAFGTMMALAFILFLLLEFGGAFLCRIFGVWDIHLAAMSMGAFRIIGVYCFAAGAVTFLNAFYRCVGKSHLSLALVLADNLVLVLAAMFVFVKMLGFGTMGVFWGIGVSPFVTLLFWFLTCRPWRRGVLLLDDRQFPGKENEFHRIVPAVYGEVSRVMEDMDKYGEAMGIPMKKQYYMILSVEELVINVVRLAEADKARKRRWKEYYADIRIIPGEEETVSLRIRDNLTEWTPADPAARAQDSLVELDEAGDVNELGIGIIRKIAKTYSYKRTIGFNNFSVTL